MQHWGGAYYIRRRKFHRGVTLCQHIATEYRWLGATVTQGFDVRRNPDSICRSVARSPPRTLLHVLCVAFCFALIIEERATRG